MSHVKRSRDFRLNKLSPLHYSLSVNKRSIELDLQSLGTFCKWWLNLPKSTWGLVRGISKFLIIDIVGIRFQPTMWGFSNDVGSQTEYNLGGKSVLLIAM